MSLGPEHPDPSCPACHGDGAVPFEMDEEHPEAFVPSEDLVSQRPCCRCLAREYDRICPVSARVVTLAPGHPCPDCGAIDQPDHARGEMCQGCRLSGDHLPGCRTIEQAQVARLAREHEALVGFTRAVARGPHDTRWDAGSLALVCLSECRSCLAQRTLDQLVAPRAT